jgi:hypothetical protein
MAEKHKSSAKLILSILLLIFVTGICWSQTSELGSWNIIGLKYNINTK